MASQKLNENLEFVEIFLEIITKNVPCQERTTPILNLSRHFCRPIYFRLPFPQKNEGSSRSVTLWPRVSFLWLVIGLLQEPHSREIQSKNKSVCENRAIVHSQSWAPALAKKSARWCKLTPYNNHEVHDRHLHILLIKIEKRMHVEVI